MNQNYRQQAVVAMRFQDTPGAFNHQFENWNLINIPNPATPRVHQFFGKEKFNI